MVYYVNWLPVRVSYGDAPPPSTKQFVGDGLVGSDPTETRDPTNTWKRGGNTDFVNPTYAYTDDSNYATLTIGNQQHAERVWDTYGFNIPDGKQIISVKVLLKGHLDGGNGLYCEVKCADRAWSNTRFIWMELSEATEELDVTDWIDTPARVNSIEVCLWQSDLGGGCFHPDMRFVTYDGKNFGLVPASKLTMDDPLLGINRKTLEFQTTKVTHLQKHVGKWRMIRAYVQYPKGWAQKVAANEPLRILFNLPTTNIASDILSDMCWTDNHPLYTRNKGYILAGDLKVGDFLGELYYENGKLQCGGLQIIHIEEFMFEGDVYDVRCKECWLFSKYLLGHMSKDTPE